jgi:ATP/maltotriose-dependent transcriptional regulator MalT
MGLLALAQGNIDEARSLIHKSLDLFAGFTTGWDIVQSNVFLGEAAAAAGDLPEARRIYLETLPMAMEVHVMSLVMDILIGLADLAAWSGEVQQALELAIFVGNNKASTQITKDRASLLETQVGVQLTSHQIQKAKKRAKAQKLETIVAEILGEEITPI